MESVTNIFPAWNKLLPEIALSIGLIILILHALFTRKYALVAFVIYVITLMAAAFFLEKEDRISDSMLVFDDVSKIFQHFILVAAALSGMFLFRYTYVEKKTKHLSESYTLLLMGVMGSFLLTSATHFLLIFLALEIISLSSYLLVASDRGKKAAEAALKYFLFGGIVTGLFIFGVSLLYGYTKSLDFTSYDFIRGILFAADEASLSVVMVSFLIFAGFFFKVSFVPFHIWIPDVYQGSTPPVTVYLSLVPKLAGFAVLIRFLSALDNVSLIFIDVDFDYRVLIAGIAIITLIISNAVALLQRNIKRMLAYSSISHSAFMVMALLSFNERGIESFWYYFSVYMVMNVAVFYFAWVYKKQVGDYDFDSYRKLSFQWFPAVLWLVLMASLTGIPPLAGFTAKFLVFTVLWETYQRTGDLILIYLLGVGVITTVISLFFYMRIPYMLYFNKKNTGNIKVNAILDISVIAVLCVILVVLFMIPGLLIGWVNNINFVF